MAWRSGLGPALRVGPSVQAALALARQGISPATALSYGAARYPDAVALVDDFGALTFAQVSRRVSVLAAGLEAMGVGSRDRVGLACRNHRHFVMVLAALSELGSDVLLLNTSFAPPELAGALKDSGATAVVCDRELSPLVDAAAPRLQRLVVPEGPRVSIEGCDPEGPLRGTFRLPARPASHYILLTSGTTGRPKAKGRRVPLTVGPVVGLLERIPLRVRDTTVVAAPLFHAWGLGTLALCLMLSHTVVLATRFDPEGTLGLVAGHRAQNLTVVPTMLQRILELPERARCRHDTSSLKIVASSGSALTGDLAGRFMDAYGEVLHNLYGSTEVAWAAIATPKDLRDAPGTAGRAPRGTTLEVLDADGRPVAHGRTGAIFVGNALALGTGPGPAPTVATGDVGHLDSQGRLFVEGRQDDMIVSGGENFYPQEIEDVIARHPAVAEVAVLAEPDPRLGQRVRALVVLRPDHPVAAEELGHFARSRLARFKVPREFTFVDTLERTETGKIAHRRDP